MIKKQYILIDFTGRATRYAASAVSDDALERLQQEANGDATLLELGPFGDVREWVRQWVPVALD